LNEIEDPVVTVEDMATMEEEALKEEILDDGQVLQDEHQGPNGA